MPTPSAPILYHLARTIDTNEAAAAVYALLVALTVTVILFRE